MIISSCNGPKKHYDFSTLSDYPIYENEVISERIDHGRIEHLDSAAIKERRMEAFRNVYLLYYDSSCVAVYNQHPKYNLPLMEQLIKAWRTDSTRLASVAKLDEELRLTVSRYCSDAASKDDHGKFVDWKVVRYVWKEREYVLAGESLLNSNCNW